MSGIDYFRYRYGDIKEKQFTDTEMLENNRQNFKRLIMDEQLRYLFYYIKERTKNGLYKKEDNRVIGEYFGVGKDLINTRIKKLISLEYLSKISELDLYKELKERDKYYKLLKESW